MPFVEVIEHLFLLSLDAVSCRLDFPDGTCIDFLIPVVQIASCRIPCEFLIPEHGSYGVDQRICLPELWIQFKEQMRPFLLVLSPFLTRLGQHVPAPGEQFDQGVSGAEHGGTVLLLPDALASALLALRLLLSAFLRGVFRPAVCTFPSLGILALLPRSLFLLRRCDGQPLEAQAHLVKGLAQPLHDVEAVDDDGGIGEALAHDGVHGVAEVHRHFLDLLTLCKGDHLQYPGNDLGLGALDDGYDGALAAMSGLVGEYRVDVIAYHHLVYRVVLAEVLRQQHPVCSMSLLVPLIEFTQALLVVALQSAALDVKETGYGGTRDGEIIQDRL